MDQKISHSVNVNVTFGLSDQRNVDIGICEAVDRSVTLFCSDDPYVRLAEVVVGVDA